MLHKMLSENKTEKMMIFMNSCSEVAFYGSIFSKYGFNVVCIQVKIHSLLRIYSATKGLQHNIEIASANYLNCFSNDVAVYL